MAPVTRFIFSSLVVTASILDVGAVSHAARRQWAHYRRQVEAGTATTADLPQVSPVSGATIDLSVQQQVKSDVHTALTEFTGLPDNVQNVLKTALSQILDQKIYTYSPEQQYSVVSSAIANQLQKVEDSLPIILGNITALDDTGNMQAMQDCLMSIVSMGGRKSDDDGTCLSTSGFSIDSIIQQFNDFVDINQFTIPTDKANAAAAEITAYLNSVDLVPSVEYLIGNASEAIQNVIDTTAAKDRDATKAAFQCWLSSLYEISEKPLADRELACDRGVSGTTAASGQSTLSAIEERYMAITNQYAGALPPTLAYNIQALGVSTLTLNVGTYDYNVRDRINDAILSATAATSGESASLVGSLIDCLNTIYDDTPDETCNPNSDPAILLHNENVYFNYLSQFVSILPKTLVQELNSTVQTQLEGDTTVDADALRSQLQSLWEQASLGSQYEDCERSFVECSIAAVTGGSATTDCHVNAPDSCGALPSLAASKIDSSNPYSDLINGLKGDGKWGTKRKAKAKRMLSAALKKRAQKQKIKDDSKNKRNLSALRRI